MIAELYLARRYIFRGKTRHISFIGVVSCLGVALGVAALIIAFSVVNGTDGELLRRIMKFKDHLIVDAWQAQDLPKIKDELNKWEEVELAYTNLSTQVFAKFGNGVMPLVVKGVDLSDKKVNDFFYKYVKEDSGTPGFFVGEGITKRFLLGENLEFYPLKRKLRLQERPIRGTFKVGLYEIDNYYLIDDLEAAKEFSPNYSLVLGVILRDPYAAEQVKEKLYRYFPDTYVNTWIESNQAIFSTIKLERMAMFIILSLIIIIASFNIFSTLTVKVVEKTKDIGILKAIGFSRRKIISIFALQGLIIGFIGVVLGFVLGVGACWILIKYPFIKVPEQFFGTEYLPIAINYNDVSVIILAGIFIAFISSLIPAYKAGSLPTAKALRYE